MKDIYQELFAKLPIEKVSGEFRTRVLQQITRLEYRALMLRRAVFGLGVFLSLVALIPASSYTLSELSTSGFSQYVSLIYSDTGFALTNWSDFFYLLAESFPAIGGIFILFALFTFFAALNQFLRYRPFDYSSYRLN